VSFVAFGLDVHNPYHDSLPATHEDRCPVCGVAFVWTARESWAKGFRTHTRMFHSVLSDRDIARAIAFLLRPSEVVGKTS
jgi:hypothetical protein